MQTPPWTIFCRLVLDMKKYTKCALAVLPVMAIASINVFGSVRELYTPERYDDSAFVEELVIPYDVSDPVENPVNNYVENPVDTVENPVDYVDDSELDTSTDVPAYTDEQLEILAIIIYQESGADTCSDDTRRKVGSVFLNRVESTMFPNTFEEVALQDRQYGTLCWTGIIWPDRAYTEQESHAVERAYSIAEELLVDGSILPSNVIWQAEFTQGDGIYCHQDDIYFCYTEEN